MKRYRWDRYELIAVLAIVLMFGHIVTAAIGSKVQPQDSVTEGMLELNKARPVQTAIRSPLNKPQQL